jgi:glucose/arabinose dehydrogenase
MPKLRIPISILAATGAALAAGAACSQQAPKADPAAAKAGDVVIFGDWKQDAPGVVHHITPADLQAPFTSVGTGMAKVVPPAAGALPKVPAGLQVAVFTDGLKTPRAMRTAPNGDIFVSEQEAGRVRILRAADGAAHPAQSEVFVDGLDNPFGVAFYPLGANPQWIYVAEQNKVVRYPYQNGDLKVRGPAETVIAQLAPTKDGHWTRDLAFSADGQRLFVSVGSKGNLDEGMGKKPAPEAIAYDKAHGLGAAWGDDENRADVLVADPAGKGVHVFAAGIRNCSGLTRQPQTGEIWCSTNERDMLGDNLAPDYATHVQEGAFYGWPWYYTGNHEEPRLKGERPDLNGHVTTPDVLLQAHSAAVQIRFYDGKGPNALPASYDGAAFISLHGSWNRTSRTGYKVVLAPIKGGKATGEYVDFMTGFVANDSDVWGRPYGLTVMHDGSLLVGDDANGRIYRVTPTK